MNLYQTPAIVLRRQQSGEAAKIITFFTRRFGKLRAIARGVRKTTCRYGSGMEVFSHNDIILYMKENKTFSTVTQCSIIESFQDIREDLYRFASATYIVELIDEIVKEREVNLRLFNFLLATLRYLHKESPLAVLTFFQMHLLNLTGFRPQINHCVGCRFPIKPPFIYYSVEKGGILCAQCYKRNNKAIQVSPEHLLFLRQLQLSSIPLIEGNLSHFQKKTWQLLHFHLIHLLGKEIKSREFLERIERM